MQHAAHVLDRELARIAAEQGLTLGELKAACAARLAGLSPFWRGTRFPFSRVFTRV